MDNPSHIGFSVFDSKIGAFASPFFAPSRGAAVRAFSDEVKRDGSDFAKHPEDYILYQLCHYDDKTGVLAPLIAPEQVAKASDYVEV